MNEPNRWIEFLDETIEEKASIRELKKFFGYCLTRDTHHQKALILIGPGGNGKSVLLNILQEMVGEKNCSSLSISEMLGTFYLKHLVGKRLNVLWEVDSKALSSDIFKSIVSGDKVVAHRQRQTPIIFRPFCKMVFETNQYPQILNTSNSLFRRFLIIKMEKRTYRDKPDVFLMDKLQDELSVISRWAEEGLKLLEREGFLESVKKGGAPG